MSATLAIVIPTYNEADNIASLLTAIQELDIKSCTIYIVDDSSPDGTADIVDALHLDNVQVIRRAEKLGIGSAYIHGFGVALGAGAEYVLQMDADFSHAPSDIQKLLTAVESEADLAIGSRRVRGGRVIGWGPRRRLMSWGAMTFARILLSLDTYDVTAGFRCFRAPMLRQMLVRPIASSGYAFQEEMLYIAEQMDATIVEIPVVFEDRAHGTSKLSRKDIVEFFRTMLRLKMNG